MTETAPTGCVLITGVAGFIGSHLAARFSAQGRRVVGIDNFDPFYDVARKHANLEALASNDFTFLEADIRDREAVERTLLTHRPELIVHLAALAGVRPSIERPLAYMSVNVEGTTLLLETAQRCGVRDFVFASSSSVYGNRSQVPFHEDDDCGSPISPYAATKRAGELICQTYAHLYGLSIGSLRFFTVFGPAQRPDLAISHFMDRIAAGEEITMFGDGTTSRDYTFIDDIVDGIVSACASVRAAADGTHRIWNLGGSQPVALSDMIERIGGVVGRTPRVRQLPMQPGDVERTYADLSRSALELGYAPRVSFDAGLARQWAWRQSQRTS